MILQFCSFFRGAVSVSMDIRMLDIDQCPGKYHMPNAFKDTHKCDDKSSYVSTEYRSARSKPKRA